MHVGTALEEYHTIISSPFVLISKVFKMWQVHRNHRFPCDQDDRKHRCMTWAQVVFFIMSLLFSFFGRVFNSKYGKIDKKGEEKQRYAPPGTRYKAGQMDWDDGLVKRYTSTSNPQSTEFVVNKAFRTNIARSTSAAGLLPLRSDNGNEKCLMI